MSLPDFILHIQHELTYISLQLICRKINYCKSVKCVFDPKSELSIYREFTFLFEYIDQSPASYFQ